MVPAYWISIITQFFQFGHLTPFASNPLKCKNLIEELCTNDEIIEALVEQAKIRRPDGAAIKSRRNAHAGTQSVYVSLPAEDAKKVLAIGYIKVGFIRSRVVEVIEPKRCYKCWGYGLTSITGKEQDRTKLCRKCGEDGHKAATCTNPRKCALCNGNHSVGNVMCPHYQEAVRKLGSWKSCSSTPTAAKQHKKR